MTTNIKLDILPNGKIRFNRGSKEYNKAIKDIISAITEEIPDDEMIKFFSESEDIEVLFGDRIFCG